MIDHRKFLQTTLLVLAALALAACRPESATTSGPQALSEAEAANYLQRSEAIAGKLQKALGSRLMAAMQEGSAPAAIGVCQRIAQDVTAIVGKEYADASITRTALQVRNPINKPNPESVEVLENWQDQHRKGKTPEADLIANANSVIVHRPIMTAPICLQCHGELSGIEPETLSLLRELYPKDSAVGYQAGDLRGAFRIEFVKSAAERPQ